MGTAITAITVPEADGTPAPTYAAEGILPAGIAFDTTTRVISGTPTATGNGTITIRATNSEGDADWTITYATTAPASAPSRPDAPTLTVDSDTQITAVGVAPNNGGDTITSYDWRYRETGPLGPWLNRFDQTNLTQIFTGLDAAQGHTVSSSEPPTQSGTARIRPTPMPPRTLRRSTLTAPAFADDTGDDQDWDEDVAIAAITVPTATGNPTPTYAVE